jgi:hypothetical protein
MVLQTDIYGLKGGNRCSIDGHFNGLGKMKKLILVALACGVSTASAREFTIGQLDQIATLPCSIFQGDGWGFLKEGVTLTIPLSSTNNSELFARLGERLNRCRNSVAMAESPISAVAPR